MTDHPINSVFVDGSANSKSADRSYFKDRVRLRVANADEVRSHNYSDSFGVDIAGLIFDRDTSDTTTADNGTTCVVDYVGTRFKLVSSGGGGGSGNVTGPVSSTNLAFAVWSGTGGDTLSNSLISTDVGGHLFLPAYGAGILMTDVSGDVTANSAATVKTFLGLVPGTNVQAYSATLDLFAAITDPGADRLVGWDDSASAFKALAITDMTAEASPAAGDLVVIYGAEGDLRLTDWSNLPGVGGGDTIGNRLAKTAAYTVVNGDRTKTIALAGASFYTLTFSAASGYDANFWVDVVNEDTRCAKKISLNGTTWRLWPGQRVRIYAQNNVWYPSSNPQRWRLPAGDTIVYVKPSTGANGNDGSSGFEIHDVYKALEMVANEFDLKPGGNYCYIRLRAGETDTFGCHVAAQSYLCADGLLAVTIDGETGGVKPIIAPTAAACFSMHNGAHVQIMNLKLSPPAGYCSIEVQRDGRITIGDGVEFGAATSGGAHIYLQSGGYAEIAGNISISGGAASFALTVGSGAKLWAQPGYTITFTADVAFTRFVEADDLSYQYWASTIALNTHTITGARYLVQGGANINPLGGGASFFPGNSAGANNGGWYDGSSSGGSGLSAVVDDTTPQLGGDLDLNTFHITGLQIGTDVQAYSTMLTSFAAITDPAMDRLVGWDDSASAMKALAIADMTAEAAPASGDKIVIYGAEGDLRLTDWSLLPSGSGDTIGNRLAKTAAYTVLNADRTKTFALGGTAFYTLTFSAASGYDANWWCYVTNEDTARAKRISLNGTIYRLWPGQTAFIYNQNSVWYISKPNRYALPSNDITLLVKPSTGSDTNADGLATGSEFASLRGAMDIVQNEFDLRAHGFYVYLKMGAGETDTSGLHIATAAFLGADGLLGVTIDGDTSGTRPIIATTGKAPISLHNGTHVQVKNVKLSPPAGYNCLEVQRGARVTIGDGVEFGAATSGGAHIYVQSGGYAEIAGNIYISGGAYAFGLTVGSGAKLWAQPGYTIQFLNSVAFTRFVDAEDLAYQYWASTIDLNAKTITGIRYWVNGGANINPLGGGSSFFPGGTAGVNSGGWYDGTYVAQNNSITTAALADASVTYAKMQNVSATSRVLLRKTAGAGSVEEGTASDLLNFLSTTQGAILYRGASGWSALGPGTSGQFLKTNGAAADPAWASVSGSGTVTSVAMTVPSILSVSGSPITTSGTFGVTLANQSANLAFMGPASGSAAAPTFRSLVAADLPLLLRDLGVADSGSLPSSLGNVIAEFAGTNTANARLQIVAIGGMPGIAFDRIDGTRASPSAVQSGDALGRIEAYGYGATARSASARVVALMKASQNWTDTAQGGYWEFQVTPDNSTTAVTRFALNSAGNIQFSAYGAGIAMFDSSGIVTSLTGTPLRSDVTAQTITGGARVTINDLGTKSSGTVTPDPGDRPVQKYTNNGAHTLAPGTNYGSYILWITNGASAGAITTSGWTKVSGDSFDTTSGHKFCCSCLVSDVGSYLVVGALQ